MSKRPAGGRTIPAKAALIAVNKHLLFHCPTMFTGAQPRRLTLPDDDLWLVPIVLTHPEYGSLGEVGLVGVDARTGQVLASTPRNEVVTTGRRLRLDPRTGVRRVSHRKFQHAQRYLDYFGVVCDPA